MTLFVCGKELDCSGGGGKEGIGTENAELVLSGFESIGSSVGGPIVSKGVDVLGKAVVNWGSLSVGTSEMIVTLLVTVGGNALLVREEGETVGGNKLLVSEVTESHRLVGGPELGLGELVEVKLPGVDKELGRRDVGAT